MTRNLGRAVLLASVLLMSGCMDLLSLHALHTAQDRVFDAALEGRWEDDDNALVVERDANLYKVQWEAKKPPSEPTEYEVHLVDISGVRFADALRLGAIGHMVLRVRIADGQLRLAFFDSKWLRDQTPHEKADVDQGDTMDVLTASTPQLRTLVGRFAREPKAYDEHELTFKRAK